jgi:hypothetical protein
MLRAGVMVTLATLSACVVGLDAPFNPNAAPDAGSAETDAGTTYDQLIVSTVSAYQTWPQISKAPYTSNVGSFQINVFAFGDVADYRSIHPEVSGSNIAVDVGTIIVREVLDASGRPSELTVVAKAPAGFNASVGDLWFGALDSSGIPQVVDGQIQLGKLAACAQCHIPRSTDAYLFGVPAADE